MKLIKSNKNIHSSHSMFIFKSCRIAHTLLEASIYINL